MTSTIQPGTSQPGTSSTQQKIGTSDLTHAEDLSFGVMNLISLEEHLAMSAVKANRKEYLTILKAVRKERITLQREIVTNTEGECWCISKHLLAATMRLMETATKYLETNPEQAFKFEQAAFELYSLFWLIQELPKAPEEPQTTGEPGQTNDLHIDAQTEHKKEELEEEP